MAIVKGSVLIDITISPVPATMQTSAENSASGLLLILLLLHQAVFPYLLKFTREIQLNNDL
jgi:hypothetical protein